MLSGGQALESHMSRADRRRQEKEDQRLVARGIDVNRRDPAQVIALMRALRQQVAEAQAAGTVAPLIGYLHENFEAASRRAPRRDIACAKGCAHCCHVWVSVRAPEVLFLLPVLRAKGRSLSIDESLARTAALDVEARRQVAAACPMLGDDSLCQIYATRPLACRAAVSADADACERAYRLLEDMSIPVPDAFRNQKTSYTVALAGALRHAGFPYVSYEFNSALQAVLARPDAEAAWLAGEDVFAAARRDPAGDPFVNPSHQKLYEAAFG